jgi:hypothetical protein
MRDNYRETGQAEKDIQYRTSLQTTTMSTWELPKTLKSGSRDVAPQKVRLNHAGIQVTVRWGIRWSPNHPLRIFLSLKYQPMQIVVMQTIKIAIKFEKSTVC